MAKRNRNEIDSLVPVSKYQRVGVVDSQKFKLVAALDFLEQVKLQFSDQQHVFQQFESIMQRFKTQEIDSTEVVKRVGELFRGYDHLIEGFEYFIPYGHKLKSFLSKSDSKDGDKKTIQRKDNDKEFNQSSSTPTVDEVNVAKKFIAKVKSRFIDKPEVYRTFLRTMKAYRKTEISLKELFVIFTNLFSDYTDLLIEFPKFLPEPYQRVQDVAQVDDYTFFETARIQLRNEPKLYGEFLKCLELVNQQILSPGELLLLVEDLFSDYPDLFDQFRQICEFSDEEDNMKLLAPKKKQEGIFSRPEIDYSTCKRLGPSYRALPKEYIQPPSSGRTPLCSEVLNDLWVSLPTGSEEGANFKSSRKNAFEETLFKCEDDRYEIDMIIEQNFSTLERLKNIQNKIAKMPKEALSHIVIEEYLDVLHIRSIERIYGEKRAEILSNLYTNPVVAIPIIIRRLAQKDEEWRDSRVEWNKTWRKIHEKNYFKSLDHQSTTFKQKDKKTLTFREFLVEINKEKFLKKKNNSNEDHLTYQVEYPHILVDIFSIIQKLLKDTPQYVENLELELFLEEFFSDFFMTETPVNPCNANKNWKILYGNDDFFVFIRLIITAYNRLACIMNCSCNFLKQTIPTEIRSTIGSSGKDFFPACAEFGSLQELYRYYIDQMLCPLLNNEGDQNKFEEECKQLFGNEAYLLFTMDHILKTAVERVEMICSDDNGTRLLALYYFETNRVFEGDENYVYRTNSCEIIGNDRLYRFSYSKQDSNEKTRFLNISLMDHPEEYPVADLTSTKKGYKDYLRKFLNPGSKDTEDNSKTSVFLQRNKKATIRRINWNENLIIENHLEAKICMTTFRMFFVGGTEDFFYRDIKKKQLTDEKRKQRLTLWNNKVTTFVENN